MFITLFKHNIKEKNIFYLKRSISLHKLCIWIHFSFRCMTDDHEIIVHSSCVCIIKFFFVWIVNHVHVYMFCSMIDNWSHVSNHKFNSCSWYDWNSNYGLTFSWWSQLFVLMSHNSSKRILASNLYRVLICEFLLSFFAFTLVFQEEILAHFLT